MITGFNTDVEHNGRIYHVQTEDRGLKNPIIESLVYTKGEILGSRKSPYADLVASGRYSEESLIKRMEAQHKELMHEIRSGKFSGDEEPKPFGHSIVTNRSLDQVVLGFLEESLPSPAIALHADPGGDLEEGTSPNLKLRVVELEAERPVEGATVTVRLISRVGPPRKLFSAATDGQGRVDSAFEIPELGKDAAIVCHADVGGRTTSFRRRVRRRAGVAAPSPQGA